MTYYRKDKIALIQIYANKYKAINVNLLYLKVFNQIIIFSMYLQCSSEYQTDDQVNHSGQRKFQSAQFRKLPLPLAPFNEQIRIVGKVEELFSFLDAGVASLRAVQAQLKRYRQAVLKHAFEGKLTEQWRIAHKNKIELQQNLLLKVQGMQT